MLFLTLYAIFISKQEKVLFWEKQVGERRQIITTCCRVQKVRKYVLASPNNLHAVWLLTWISLHNHIQQNPVRTVSVYRV